MDDQSMKVLQKVQRMFQDVQSILQDVQVKEEMVNKNLRKLNAEIADISAKIKNAETKLKMKNEHYEVLVRMVEDKNSEIEAVNEQLKKVSMLASMKSEAYKLSAEVQEVVSNAKKNTDGSLVTTEIEHRSTHLRKLTEELSDFAEILHKRRIRVDISEGRVVTLKEKNEEQLKELDANRKEIEERFNEYKKASEELKKREEALDKARKFMELGIQQRHRDMHKWKMAVETESYVAVNQQLEAMFCHFENVGFKIIESSKASNI